MAGSVLDSAFLVAHFCFVVEDGEPGLEVAVSPIVATVVALTIVIWYVYLGSEPMAGSTEVLVTVVVGTYCLSH